MAKVRNISGVDRSTRNRLVLAGAAIEVPIEECWGYTQQLETWEAFDDAAREVHQFNLDAIAYYLAELEAEELAREQAFADAEAAIEADIDGDGAPDEQPGGNASRDEWAAYVIGAGLATEDELDGKGRDEIRDTYKLED